MALPWKDSRARRLLEEDLISGEIPLDPEEMDARTAYYPEFADHTYEQFRDRLRDARARGLKDKSHAISDEAVMEQDGLLYPKRTHNDRGVPRWDGSDAQRLLKQDFNEGNHLVEPKVLHQSREEYKKFPLQVFRGHIDQEKRLRKWFSEREKKQKKKDEKMQKKEGSGEK